MIEQKVVYIAKCGKCGKEFNRWRQDQRILSPLLCGETLGYTKKYLTWLLKLDGWKRKGKKWYCPDCQKGKK